MEEFYVFDELWTKFLHTLLFYLLMTAMIINVFLRVTRFVQVLSSMLFVVIVIAF